MIDMILTAKHWKIFFIMIFIPIVLMICSSLFIFFAQLMTDGSNLFLIFLYSLTSTLGMLPLIWFWSVGKGLQRSIPEHLSINLNHKFFNFVMLYLIVSWALQTIYNIISQISGTGDSSSVGLSFPTELAIMFVFAILSLVAFIYLCLYIAKSLIIAETQEDTDFKEYLGILILCVFLPIGIWIVQPRINDLVEVDDE